MTPLPDPISNERRLALTVLIVCAVGLALGRIAGTEYLNEPSVHKETGSPVPRPAWPSVRPEPYPTFSSNDRSRWATVRALVDEGTFVIGRRGKVDDPTTDRGIVFEDGWKTVDKVLNPETQEYYSTKPPLLTLLAAGEYWILKKVFCLSLVEDRWLVVRTVLVTFNLIPFILYLLLMADLASRFSTSSFTCYFLVAAAAFAGMIWPFLITFNNHTPATVATALALWAVVRISLETSPGGWLFAVAGLAAGFTFTCEMPALSLLGALFAWLVWSHPLRTLGLFLPAALLPIAGLVLGNYAQLGRFTPAYAEFGGPWYEYVGSHWRVPAGTIKRGIDFAGRNGESRADYAFHLLVGHHGYFSLLPVMLLALPGMVLGIWRWRNQDRTVATWGLAALLCLLVSIAVIGFYLVKSDNYGGWCNGPRWLMWLAPLWLVTMIPVVDWLGRSRAGMALALVLLMASMMSMNYQAWNPWRHPWIYNWMDSRGWIHY